MATQTENEPKSQSKADLDLGKDKLYMNLNIQYKTGNYSSRASEEFNLLQPIIDHGGNFQMTVTDMQIDTRLVPLFIAEIKDYQEYGTLIPYSGGNAVGNNTYIELNYWVKVDQGMSYGEAIYLKKPIYRTMSAMGTVGEKKYYYNNNHKDLYIYSYQEFLDLVNVAIQNALPPKYRNRGCCGFAIQRDKLIFLIQDMGLYSDMQRNRTYPLEIWFSESLFQYLGVGFPVIHNGICWKFTFPETGTLTNSYFALIQNEPGLQHWNGCKAIIVYSRNLPIAEEVFPTIDIHMELTHYSNPQYQIRNRYTTSEIKNKIIYSHYIDYSKIRSLINGITVHNTNVENGLKIDLEKALPIRKFDINVGWVDNFGNLFPLELPYGGCCNIRVCFSRRQVSQYYDYTEQCAMNDAIYPQLYEDPAPFDENPDEHYTFNYFTPNYSFVTPQIISDYELPLNEFPDVPTPEINNIIENLNEITPVTNEEQQEENGIGDVIIDENTMPGIEYGEADPQQEPEPEPEDNDLHEESDSLVEARNKYFNKISKLINSFK